MTIKFGSGGTVTITDGNGSSTGNYTLSGSLVTITEEMEGVAYEVSRLIYSSGQLVSGTMIFVATGSSGLGSTVSASILAGTTWIYSSTYADSYGTITTETLTAEFKSESEVAITVEVTGEEPDTTTYDYTVSSDGTTVTIDGDDLSYLYGYLVMAGATFTKS